MKKQAINTLRLNLLVAIMLIVVSSCTNAPKPQQPQPTDAEISKPVVAQDKQNVDSKTQHNSVFYTKYKLPLPVELYLALKEQSVPYNKNILSSLANFEESITSVSKAMNLGFYSSDLAYCTVFEQNKDATDYFELTKKLSEDLKINVGYTEETVNRFHRNIGNSDSLYNIASENYWKTCDFLEETQHVNVLPFIIVGSWVESMHLSIHAIEKAPQNEQAIMERVAMQREPLTNLIQYLYSTLADIKVFKINQDIQRIVKELKSLQQSFDAFDTNPKGTIITKEQFEDIADKIKTIRSEYMKIN